MGKLKRLFDYIYGDYDNLSQLLERLLEDYPYLIEKMYPWLDDEEWD